jgi:hypothetical protein
MFGNIREDWEDAALHGRIASEISREHGFDVWLATSSMQLAIAEAASGRVKEGIATLSAILAAYEAGGAEITVSYYYARLSDLLRLDDQTEAALTATDKGIAHAERNGEHFYLAVLLRQRAELRAALGASSVETLAALSAAAEFARKQDALEFAVRADAARARFLN